MYISPSSLLQASELSTFDQDSNKAPAGGWSSLIGVITAIVGNILISFALNTQRYAHLRLSRDQQKSQREKQRSSRGQNGTAKAGNGTTGEQRDIAQERAQKNMSDRRDSYTLENPDEANERQPLIPKVKLSRDDSSSRSQESDDTIRPNEKDEEDPKTKSYLKSPIWWVGIALMIVGEAGNFLAYGFAPASIVSPLGVVALVSNCLVAPLLLGEKFRWRDAIGVLIAVGGCVVVVLSASESNPRLGPHAIWDLITRWEFETYLGITVVLIICLAVASNKFGDKSILIDLGLVGLFGGYTALSTKGVASLLSNTIWRVVTFPITYLLVAVLVFTAIMQIKYVNRALQRFNATMVIPTQFVLFTLSVIIGSAVLYRDFERETTEDAIKFVCGCGLTFFGVWCITSGRNTENNDEADNDEEGAYEEEADGIDLINEDNASHRHRASDASKASYSASSSHSPAMIATGGRSLSDAIIPQVLRQDQRPSTPRTLADLPSVTPGTISAIHFDPTQPLDTTPTKPSLHATTSAPILPTTPKPTLTNSKAPLIRTPSNRSAYNTQLTANPALTPINQSPYLDTPPHRLLSRSSVVGLIPGPFTSPLSGSLSAIVADELRRGFADGHGSVRRKSLRPLNSHVGTVMGEQERVRRASIASGEMEFEGRAGGDGVVGGESVSGDGDGAVSKSVEGRGKGRLRSLSSTIGDMFRSSPGKRRKGEEERDGDGE